MYEITEPDPGDRLQRSLAGVQPVGHSEFTNQLVSIQTDLKTENYTDCKLP